MLGGAGISATKRATAETLATLGVELSQLTDRFASGGRGASSDDLALYLRLSGNVATMLEGAGLKQNTNTENHSDARAKISDLLGRIINAQKMEEAQGIFRDNSGSVITDPLDIELEKQIYALKQRRGHLHDAPAPLMLSPPTPVSASASTSSTPAPASTPASKPATPAPITAEKSSTDLFYEWSAAGGGRPSCGPI
jgi:hypothetical protein